MQWQIHFASLGHQSSRPGSGGGLAVRPVLGACHPGAVLLLLTEISGLMFIAACG